MSRPVKVAVLISGRGSNMQALIEAAREPGYPAEITLVFSNDPEAEGLRIADRAGVPTRGLSHRGFATREAFEEQVDVLLEAAGTQLICLAGFMRRLSPSFVERWSGRMINIHPSLLPAFRGLHSHERALEAGVRIHGCTVHYVVPEVDAGPIVAQSAVLVLSGDTPDSLAARVLIEEHRLYPAALKLVASGAVRLEQGRVVREADADPSRLP